VAGLVCVYVDTDTGWYILCLGTSVSDVKLQHCALSTLFTVY